MGGRAQANNINILNSIRELSSLAYQDRIPTATAENVNAIYKDIMNVEAIRNAFVNALVERIAIVAINDKIWTNPLRDVKDSAMPYGAMEQEIFVNFCKAHQFNPSAGYEEAFAFYEANVMAAYHKLVPPMQYAVTISYDQLRSAFTNDFGIRDLIKAKVNALYNGANWDEFLITKQLIESGYSNGALYPVNVPEITDKETAESALIAMKATIGKMKFPKPMYNIAGATSFSEKADLILITTPDNLAYIDVKALAMAYNEGRADVDVRTIEVDEFSNENIVAFLCDRRWFRIRDNYRTMSNQGNGASLTWNYFYTVSEMFSVSPFMPAVVFTKETPGVTSITINTTEYTAGSQVKLDCTVVGSGYIPKSVDWEITGGATSKDTAIIPGSNILIVGADETGTIALKVTSRYLNSVSKAGNLTKAV